MSTQSGWFNIVINVALPVFALHRLTGPFGPAVALGVALIFPVSKGLWDLWKERKLNYFAVLGLTNVSMTGTLALLGLDGMWFSVKEAFFPALVGSFVWASSYTKNPFIQTILVNPQLMHLERIEGALKARHAESPLPPILRRTTQQLASTFVVSAVVNFFLAIRIFEPIDSSLNATAHASILNHQIATMTMSAMAAILLPSMFMLVLILLGLLKRIREATGLTNEEILKS